MQKLDGKSLDLTQENINALKQLFPEIVTEGKIDFDKLKLILGEEIEIRKEKYEFTWHGKTQAIKLAQTPSTGTLRPDKESSKNWDTTENLYIEGDNLEVLKLLQKSYFGKIKMIYIDPPYNTGKDFVYKDDFRDNIKNYKELTHQTTRANTESNGRYHTDWLNMMYPRLKLARNLLTEDGVVFISIDDHEVHNIRKICDEIFGEVNFIAEIIWEKIHTRKNSAKYFSDSHEYILCYTKNKIFWDRNLIPRENTDSYTNPDNDPKGPWKSDPIYANNPYEADYEIKKPNGVILKRPQGKYWRYSEETIKAAILENRILWGEGESYPTLKRYLSEVQDGLVPTTLFKRDFAGDNSLGNNELKDIFGMDKLFSYPKPAKLIKILLQIGTNQDSIVLDFFSGSATTAHAVMQINAEDGGNRKFIMVQLPELTDENSEAFKAGYKNICEIGKERIRRAGDKIVKETGKTDLDIGFKVFKLDSSNLKPWDPDYENLENDITNWKENIKKDRTKEDLLYEILLKIGIPLTTQIEEIDFNGRTIYNVAYGSVLLCLEDNIDQEIVNEMIKLKPEGFDTKFIFKESGFISDSVKTNAIQTLKKNGITDVRSV
ncbi:site-specific DNA-methyltransferase [Tepidibacillus fermentans]|uniref:Adenine-specific DNA-methyltransferase n=1 Tax=Tepidibacillus fermentans TaxID=1281767 RepID=A0A4R3KKS6_9BACI|nr:site-specific DNA-methyltransferase [Tepidibacillus fermentans]TCS84501.1 adenine-specific DNA-methyltransferase [Tepidibacillus fermentans]